MNEEERIIRENPKHLKCPHCGHEEDIYGAAVVPKAIIQGTEDEGSCIVFGSAADFCTKCDKPWGRNEEVPLG